MNLPLPPELIDAMPQFALLLMRTGGLVAFCPIFGSNVLPARIRFGIAVALAVSLWPAVPASSDPGSEPVAWVVAASGELAVGFGLGLAARVLFDGIEGAARLVAGQSGFALSSMLDPLTGSESVTPALFQNLLATSLFLAADLHHLFIKGLQHSYVALPGGAGAETRGIEGSVVLLGTHLFVVAVQLSAPALVVTFAVDLVLVLVGRALQQVPILMVGYPLKMAVGLVAMVILTSATGAAMGWIGRLFVRDATAALAALGS